MKLRRFAPLLLAALASVALGDTVETISGTKVTGEIVAETADSLIIRASGYGELHFQKSQVKRITRDGAAPATGFSAPQAPAGGFGAPPTAGFGTPAGTAPGFGFDSAPPAPQGARTRFNPFTRQEEPIPTTQIPAAGKFEPLDAPPTPARPLPPPPSSGFDPATGFGPPTAPSQPAASPAATVATTAAPAQPRAELPDFLKAAPKPPAIAQGYDAVVFGMTEQTPIEVKQDTAASWSGASTATQLRVGSHVRTLKASSSSLLLRAKADQIRLPQESHVEIRQLQDDEVSLFLHRGSVWSQVQARNKQDAYRVETPELTAGVRGTSFRVDRVESGGSRVTVYEGAVHVTARATGVYATVDGGNHVVVNAAGQIMDLIANPPDQQLIWDDWQRWAQETALGTASAAGYGPVSALSQQIAADNARWEADMADYARNMAELRYQEKLDEYARAFLNYARDTGTIPSETEAWSVLRFHPGHPGWNGPYIDGPIPPTDPWKRPLRYRLVTSRAGNTYGRVYSLWQDGLDQGGENSSQDRVALVMYHTLDELKK